MILVSLKYASKHSRMCITYFLSSNLYRFKGNFVNRQYWCLDISHEILLNICLRQKCIYEKFEFRDKNECLSSINTTPPTFSCFPLIPIFKPPTTFVPENNIDANTKPYPKVQGLSHLVTFATRQRRGRHLFISVEYKIKLENFSFVV